MILGQNKALGSRFMMSNGDKIRLAHAVMFISAYILAPEDVSSETSDWKCDFL